MRLKIENIAMIKEADIDLSKMVVVAGPNNSGKSSIGKILYILIKTFNHKESYISFRKRKRANFSKLIDQLYFELRKTDRDLGLSRKSGSLISYKIDTSSNNIRKQLERFTDSFYDISQLSVFETSKVTDVQEILYSSLEEMNWSRDEDDLNKDLIENFVYAYSLEYCREYDVKEEYINRFRTYLKSMINDQIENVFSASPSIIELIEGESRVVSIKIQENEIIDFEFVEELQYNDVTLIESPLIIDYQNLFKSAISLTNIADTDQYVDQNQLIKDSTKDLISKLRNINVQDDYINKQLIQNTINGELQYSEKNDEFVFKSNDNEFNIINVASGIKAFGIIQMLLKKSYLSDRHLIILDEPEVHLHPKWQIKFAQLLCNIRAKLGCGMLITSHSPYFIEAIRSINEIDQSHFYFTELNMNMSSKISNYDDKLDEVFELLAQPFMELEKILFND